MGKGSGAARPRRAVVWRERGEEEHARERVREEAAQLLESLAPGVWQTRWRGVAEGWPRGGRGVAEVWARGGRGERCGEGIGAPKSVGLHLSAASRISLLPEELVLGRVEAEGLEPVGALVVWLAPRKGPGKV